MRWNVNSVNFYRVDHKNDIVFASVYYHLHLIPFCQINITSDAPWKAIDVHPSIVCAQAQAFMRLE
jgi:hypothetical protein